MQTDDNDDDVDKKKARDDLRSEAAVQTIKDVLWRFEENCEGTASLYDIVGYLVEDMISEGLCAACISETVNEAFNQAGVDPTQHNNDDKSVYH